MTLRGAYIELNFVHGEIQPTFAWIAERLGVGLDFYLLRENAELEPLATVAPSPDVTEIVVDDPHDPCGIPLPHHHFADADRYGFLVLGTAEPTDRADALAHVPLPQLHVVHNPSRWNDRHRRITPCGLAVNVVGAMPPGTVLVEPYHLGDPTRFDGASGRHGPVARTRVCVPGNVQIRRRNFGSLARGLARLRAEGATPSDIQVDLVGRARDVARLGGRMPFDGPRVQRALEDADVAEFVTMSPCELTYPELYGTVSAADFVLPLIDDCYSHTRGRIADKASGSLNVGLGSGLAPILNDSFAASVGVPIGPRYRLDDVATGLATALASDAGPLREAVAAFRTERLEASVRSFGTWLERVT